METDNKIRKKILLFLYREDNKTGLLNQDLMKKVGIKERTTNSGLYYNELKSLERRNTISRLVKKIKGNTLIYLPKNEEIAFKFWRIHDKITYDEMKYIDFSFFIIEKGFITKKEGKIEPFIRAPEYKFKNSWTYDGTLDLLLDIEDKSDYLLFQIKNDNSYPVDEIGARIYVPFMFYETGNFELMENCKCSTEYYTIFVTCDRLLPGMKAKLLVKLVPSKHKIIYLNETVKEKCIEEECVPTVKCWYKNAVCPVKGGKVTLDSKNGKYVSLSEDEPDTFIIDE